MKGVTMPNHTYKHIELTGTSNNSIEEAVQNAIKKASKTVRNMRWFNIVEVRGAIADQQVDQFQVTLKVGFTLED
jgi:flavin-binding protein dodecin